MLYSMTGYGEAAVEDERFRIGFRIRTVNNKGLDINIKLPFDFLYLEPQMRQLIKNTIFRGRIDIFCELEIRDPSLRPPVLLNEERMNQLRNLCTQMKNDYQATGELDVNTLVTLTDLTHTQRVGFELPDDVEAQILQALRNAVDHLNQSRQGEGAKLLEDFKQRLVVIEETVGEIADSVANRREELTEQIRARIRTMIDEATVDEWRVAQEVVYQADRLDITEEITRLVAHIGTTRDLLASEKRPLGKQLDFLVQEQMREVTTIGNKARHKGIARWVVRLKTEYEKVREQLLNVE